jgi:hypothetical protein
MTSLEEIDQVRAILDSSIGDGSSGTMHEMNLTLDAAQAKLDAS